VSSDERKKEKRGRKESDRERRTLHDMRKGVARQACLIWVGGRNRDERREQKRKRSQPQVGFTKRRTKEGGVYSAYDNETVKNVAISADFVMSFNVNRGWGGNIGQGVKVTKMYRRRELPTITPFSLPETQRRSMGISPKN